MPISCGPEGLPAVVFMENQKLSDTVQSEEIVSLEILQQTKASQSIAEGKGLNEAFAGHEAQFTLTTRNAQGKQCYNKNDVATVEIRDKRERECVAEVRINDNTNGIYNISYSPRVQGRWSIIVKENGEHVHGSPFPLLVKAYEQAVISRNLSSQGKSSRGHPPSPSGCRYVLQEQGSSLQSMLVVKPFQIKGVSLFGKQGSSVGMFDIPWGVAVSYSDEIAVTDRWNHRAQIFDSTSKYLRSFGCQGN